MLDNLTSITQILSTRVQLDKNVSSLQNELNQVTENLEENMKKTENNLERDIKETTVSMDVLHKRLHTKKKEQRVVNIEKGLKEYHDCLQLLDSKFTGIETIVKASKEDKDEFEKDVKSLCSQIQYFAGTERIDAREKKAAGFDDTLHEVHGDVKSIRSTTGIYFYDQFEFELLGLRKY